MRTEVIILLQQKTITIKTKKVSVVKQNFFFKERLYRFESCSGAHTDGVIGNVPHTKFLFDFLPYLK